MSTRHLKEQDQVQGTKKTLITIQGEKLSLEKQREDLSSTFDVSTDVFCICAVYLVNNIFRFELICC